MVEQTTFVGTLGQGGKTKAGDAMLVWIGTRIGARGPLDVVVVRKMGR